ncbi:MAG: DegT/DnrJ/EryC1/StrS family aminotransferase [Candidatus Komeilibacteria bacterium]|nr:DegT/DnrJ/EryC1/StrS family aminotransferase [Candidatus Komeilibacteria bacterium]
MKLISASFFSTLSARQTKAALKYFLPWFWFKIRKGGSVLELEKTFSKIIGAKYAKSFYNARSAIFQGLAACGIGEGDEVIVQAYTCVSVANAIMALGARPIYADIKPADLNIDPKKIAAAITPKTKAIMVQHTFGTPADLGSILALASAKGLILVEDCAHALGARYQRQNVGTFGKFSVFSFGRDKVISGVNGGMLATNDSELFNKLPKNLPLPPVGVILQNLLYPLIAQISRGTYYFVGLGKLIIAAAKTLKLIPKITSAAENKCQDHKILNYALPNCLADLIIEELVKLPAINSHRQKIAAYYQRALINKQADYLYPNDHQKENIYLRLVVLTSNRKSLSDYLKRQSVILGNWYDAAIAPHQVNFNDCAYQLGSCPIAEDIAQKTLNLPNHAGIDFSQAKKVADLINQWQE